MSLFASPTSFRLNSIPPIMNFVPMMYSTLPGNSTFDIQKSGSGGGEAHASLMHLAMLVFEAVMEVVCISLPGYVIARYGMFNTEHQKFVANLNVSLFTPCLIFTKLASQLTLSKIAELGVIPVLFVLMTAVSYFASLGMAKVFGFEKRARNFVIAMGVFGNSNSLPMSLIISLAHTISGLHWDKIPGDNDQEVAARGILYLLIFQQLGQLVRWSWGFHVLLAKEEEVPEQDNSVVIRYRDDETEDEDENDIDEALLHIRVDPFMSPQFENSFEGLHIPTNDDLNGARNHYRKHTSGTYDSAFESGPSGDRTPISGYPSSTSLSTQTTKPSSANSPQVVVNAESYPIDTALPRPRWYAPKPSPRISRVWAFIKNIAVRFFNGFMDFMNPPLWAMLLAIIVASVPQLQQIFFTKGTFINASVTRAVSQTGNVAVPLILVVLGANLANSTQDSHKSSHADKLETKILFASLVSRMVLPFVFIAPILALAAKFLNISILSDPVFLVVCFLLTGAPSALQLAQICQVNNVFEDVITRVLFWSYVVVILPSTLILVITAIEVVHWAV